MPGYIDINPYRKRGPGKFPKITGLIVLAGITIGVVFLALGR